MENPLSTFKNIWEIDRHAKCPVIGAMLSPERHRKILVKCGFAVKTLKPYQHHQKIMENLLDENHVSIKVNHILKSRARKQMLLIAPMTDGEIRHEWHRVCREGNVGPMLFAIAAKEDISFELLADVFGEVHMLEHANMAEVFNTRRDIDLQTRKLKESEKKRQSEKERIRTLVREKKAIEKKNRGLAAMAGRQNLELVSLKNADQLHRAHEDRHEQDRERIRELEIRVARMDRESRRLEREKRALQIENFELKNEHSQITEELNTMAATLPACINPKETACSGTSCSHYGLCAKRIFMIGGITKMKHMYKEIVEKGGGEFDYHDGYMKSGSTGLSDRVKRSDLVLCPVNCNSHAACLTVKRLCSRHDKRLKMLHSSSLSAITGAVYEKRH